MAEVRSIRSQIARLGADTAVYGISTIVGRFLNFLLVPLYTNTLPASEYGIVAVIYAVMAFLAVVFTYGLEPAFMRFIGETKNEEAKDVFSSPFWLLAASSTLLIVVAFFLQDSVSMALKLPSRVSLIVPLAVATLGLDAVNALPFAALRMERKARWFASIRFVSIAVNVSLNILFVAVWHWSIESIFVAGLIASGLCSLLLLPTILKRLRLRLRLQTVLRPMLAFGLPTLPAGLAAMVVQVVDRPIMQIMADATTAGIYQANYKLGILMMLVVSMFQYAWQPFYLQTAKQSDARLLHARVLTYFLLVGMFLSLVLTVFIGDIIALPLYHGRTLIGRAYWSGVGIVPIILHAYVFTGLGVIFSAGLIIEKRTTRLPLIAGAGAAFNIIANLLLIPHWGIYGGAWSTFGAYVVMALLSWGLTRPIYPVPWQYGRIAKILVASVLALALWYLVPETRSSLWGKLGVVVLMPLVLLGTGFFTRGEGAVLRQLLRRGS